MPSVSDLITVDSPLIMLSIDDNRKGGSREEGCDRHHIGHVGNGNGMVARADTLDAIFAVFLPAAELVRDYCITQGLGPTASSTGHVSR
jgi:hypothetical protein